MLYQVSIPQNKKHSPLERPNIWCSLKYQAQYWVIAQDTCECLFSLPEQQTHAPGLLPMYCRHKTSSSCTSTELWDSSWNTSGILHATEKRSGFHHLHSNYWTKWCESFLLENLIPLQSFWELVFLKAVIHFKIQYAQIQACIFEKSDINIEIQGKLF